MGSGIGAPAREKRGPEKTLACALEGGNRLAGCGGSVQGCDGARLQLVRDVWRSSNMNRTTGCSPQPAIGWKLAGALAAGVTKRSRQNPGRFDCLGGVRGATHFISVPFEAILGGETGHETGDVAFLRCGVPNATRQCKSASCDGCKLAVEPSSSRKRKLLGAFPANS
ncbi:hypothetical protein TgHK011_005165 [Trichoderma gracile]|nr:hypothetical protein TgHK011_005165 [Trichoderma gracile]